MLHYCSHGQRNYHLRPVDIHCRHYWEFQVFTKGHSCPDFSKDDIPRDCVGNFWIFSPDCPHGWMAGKDEECEVAVFHFAYIPEILASQFYERKALSVTLEQSQLHTIRSLAEILAPEVISPNALSPLRYNLAVDRLTLMFLEELNRFEEINHLSRERMVVNAAIAWFCSHMEEGPEIEDVAEKMGYNVSHLRRLFHLVTGEPPVREFTKQKMIRAAEMLKSDIHPVHDISVMCGYNSHSSFTRAFRHYYGMSPGEYRKVSHNP